MADAERLKVTAIEVVEDVSARARCDEGFLRLKRLRCQNRRADGSASPVYRVDMVERPALDAVAVLVYRRNGERLEVLTRKQLRPAAYFRDGGEHLLVEEIVAGVLEPGDTGEAGLRARAAEEVREESGFVVRPEQVRLLGGPFFLAPGILSEKIFPTAVDVTGLSEGAAKGDGSPLEEGAELGWWEAGALLKACQEGQVQDAKTEIALCRFLSSAGPAPR